MNQRKISIAIPNYNRVDLLLAAFEKVYDDERISEIIVSDDHSDKEVYYELEKLFKHLPKVKMFRNEVNLDCYRNKRQAVELTTNEWCILFDSDNVMDKSYLDGVYEYEWKDDTIYTPSFASPHFNFKKYEGLLITKNNIPQYIEKPLFETMLNANNFFVNRNGYLKVWDGSIDPVTSDSIYFCMKWLEAGNKIYVVPSLTYMHTVHPNSHYQNNVHRTPKGFHNNILNQLRQMA